MRTLIHLSLLSLLFLSPSCASYKISPSDAILELPDAFAEYPGGSEALKKFLANNIKYPEEAMVNGESGKVFVQFVVEKDGSLTNIEVLKGVTKALNEESVRVISTMPKWTPGVHKKMYVRSHVRMPISYILE